jgi:hypothetical protein
VAAKRRTGARVGHRRRDVEALKELVRLDCADELQERTGRKWREKLAGAVVPPAGGASEAERAARQVHSQLRTALATAHGFTAGLNSNARGECINLLRWWVPEQVSPLLAHYAMQDYEDGSRWRPGPERDRSRFVFEWTRKDFLRVHRPLTLRKLALVSLLGGNWPVADAEVIKGRGLTVADVKKAEEKRLRPHWRRYALKPQR